MRKRSFLVYYYFGSTRDLRVEIKMRDLETDSTACLTYLL